MNYKARVLLEAGLAALKEALRERVKEASGLKDVPCSAGADAFAREVADYWRLAEILGVKSRLAAAAEEVDELETYCAAEED